METSFSSTATLMVIYLLKLKHFRPLLKNTGEMYVETTKCHGCGHCLLPLIRYV